MPGLGDIFRRITGRSRRQPDAAPEPPADAAMDTAYAAEPSSPEPADGLAISQAADTPALPDFPTAPDAPAAPNILVAPDAPVAPDVPTTPDAPAAPNILATPDAPVAPDVPTTLDAPAAPEVLSPPQSPSLLSEPVAIPVPEAEPSLAQPPAPTPAEPLAAPELSPIAPPLTPPPPDFAVVGEPGAVGAAEPLGAVIAEPEASPSLEPGISILSDDDVLREDHLMLTCPYCGLDDQRIGARCQRCGQVIVRLPTWAQHRRRHWLLERLSWRRFMMSCAIVLFIMFIVWINYPFAPNPVILFKNIQTQMTVDDSPGVWSVSGRDLRNTRAVSIGFPPPEGTIVWNTQIADPLSSEPVAQYSNIYLGSANGIYPLSNTGELRHGWQGETPGRVTAAAGVVDSFLFFGSTDHTVNAWDALTGDAIWTFTAEDTVEISPVILNGLLYIGSGKGWLYALDAHNGALVWKTQLDSDPSGSVAIYDGRLMVGDEGGVFYILSARTGQEWFRFRTPKAVWGAPVISRDGKIAYFSSSGQLYAVSANRREIPGLFQFKQIWAQLWFWQVPGVPRPLGQQGGLWKFSPENPLQGIFSAPALASDEGRETLYVGGYDRTMYALDSVDGSLLWSFQATDAILASPLIVKDRLIFGDASGYLYSLHRDDGSLDWEIYMGSGIGIPPIVSNELLVVRTNSGAIYGIR